MIDDEDEPTMSTLAPLRVAYHEAAHAILARALDPNAEVNVTIRSASLGTGSCRSLARVTPSQRIQIAAAGKAAEQVLLHLADDNFENEASGDDETILRTQRKYGFSDEAVAAIIRMTHGLVWMYRAEIEILARSLLRMGRGTYKVN